MKIIYFLLITIAVIALGSCSRKPSGATEFPASQKVEIQDATARNHELSSEEKNIAKKRLLDFLKDEIQDRSEPGKTYSDPDQISDIYGKDFKDVIEEIKPSNFEGGTIVKLRTLKYQDLEHVFYVFESGKQLYAFLEITHTLDRLKTIRIGDSQEKVKSVFGSDYYTDSEDLYVYNFGSGELQFHFEGQSLDQINVSYLMI